eukprot:TRINITY_DN56023_c0_g1_i2.p1 TRINITY_DN56023_c0_g1~~TRINITY_DN56023_c0_g1_i2.p1  ORF type:complete len:183 (+),score=15.75 TRINITY_DN56023_c0_g1_i2:312-860(+)
MLDEQGPTNLLSALLSEFDPVLNVLLRQSGKDRVQKHGTALIKRFLVGTGLWSSVKPHMQGKRIHTGISTLVASVFWYRMGTVKYDRGYEVPFPPKPGDILGRLGPIGNHQYFYYKDAFPNHYGWGGFTHTYYFYLVADSLLELFAKMDVEDVRDFLESKLEYAPPDASRADDPAVNGGPSV